MTEVEVPRPEELDEQSRRSFSRRVALTTAVYAVVLAIASLGGANAMKDMLLAQQQSSDHWAFYQAKVIREHLYRAQRLALEAQRGDPAGPRAAAEGRRRELARQFGQEEQRYGSEKTDIEREAQRLERDRDRSRDRDPYFDYAAVLLQIAIVTSSVSILASSRPMYGFSLILAVAGAVLTANGFLLIFRLPFLHSH